MVLMEVIMLSDEETFALTQAIVILANLASDILTTFVSRFSLF